MENSEILSTSTNVLVQNREKKLCKSSTVQVDIFDLTNLTQNEMFVMARKGEFRLRPFLVGNHEHKFCN